MLPGSVRHSCCTDHGGIFCRRLGEWRSTDGVRSKPDCGTAALVYATLINALDYDDIYKKGHPGATVMSAALALAERIDCSGPDLIEAVVVGYEVSGRVGMSLTQSTPRKTLHGHGTWQTMGAVATAAKLLRLDVRQTAHAIAIAAANAPVASVMKTVYGARPSMAKNNFGAAAQVGVNAALLARHGFEGPLDIFEGETGFWRMFGADGCDAGRLTEGLGHLYEIREVGFKPYSCCRILQSSIEAAVEVFRRAEIDPRSSGCQRHSGVDASHCLRRTLQQSSPARHVVGAIQRALHHCTWRCLALSREQDGLPNNGCRIPS